MPRSTHVPCDFSRIVRLHVLKLLDGSSTDPFFLLNMAQCLKSLNAGCKSVTDASFKQDFTILRDRETADGIHFVGKYR